MTCNPRLSLLLPLAALAACGPPSATEFGPPVRLPKEQRPTEWSAPAGVRLGVPKSAAADGPKVWVADLPSGFSTRPPAQFRDAVWAIEGAPEADLYLTVGVGGGVAGNLKRWYVDQFGASAAPAPEALMVVELAGRTARLADLRGTFAGKPGYAGLIAFYAEGEQVTSLKFTGPEAVIERYREQFLALAKTLRSASVGPDPQAPPIQPGQPMPPDHPATGKPPGGTAASPHPTPPMPSSPFAADVPAAWTAKAGSTRPLHHTFGQDGEVYVSQIGGTLQQNLDIWRGEMGQGLLDAPGIAALPRVPMLGGQAVLLDQAGDFRSMTGKQMPGARMLVAALQDGGAVVFVKLVGNAADAAAQVDAFRAFCASVRRAP